MVAGRANDGIQLFNGGNRQSNNRAMLSDVEVQKQNVNNKCDGAFEWKSFGDRFLRLTFRSIRRNHVAAQRTPPVGELVDCEIIFDTHLNTIPIQ